jgi:hypothetical protein
MSTITTSTGAPVEMISGEAAESAANDGFATFGKPVRGHVTGQQMVEAAGLINKAIKGSRRAAVQLEEAFSTSDFTMAAFAVLDKEILAQYAEKTPAWQQYATRTTVRDFRPKAILDVLRAKVGLDRVPELTEYPAIDRKGNTVGQIQVGKYGDRFALSWESWINNTAIDELGDIPNWLSVVAAETESLTAVSQLCNASGPNTAFFKAANQNAPAALPLTLANLDAAINAIKTRKNPVGRPVYVPNLRLVVPSSLAVTAARILSAREIRNVDGTQTIISDNYLTGSVQVVEEPMLEVVNQSAKAASTWYLLPDPGAPRRSIYIAFLAGHEQPEIRVAADGGNRLGGGQVPAEDGSFEMDDVQYRVRHIVGGGTGDPLPTYCSTGS